MTSGAMYPGVPTSSLEMMDSKTLILGTLIIFVEDEAATKVSEFQWRVLLQGLVEDVLWLDVSMKDTSLVEMVQNPCQDANDIRCIFL